VILSSTTSCSLFLLWSSIQCKGGLTWHQLSCIVHRQLIYLKGSVAPDFAMFFPSSTWTWIASIDIIDIFHLGLSRPHSYHHIPCVLQVDVQWALHIHLSLLMFNFFDVIIWHFFIISFLEFVFSSTGWWKKPPKDFHSLTSIHGWQLGGITRRHYKRSTWLEQSF
jgi:hypothetical protein